MKTHKQTAFIWRESIYKNNFKCSKCGTTLADMDGTPKGNVLYDPSEDILVCPKCGQVVAKIKEIEVAVEMQGKQGDWSDFSNEPLFEAKADCPWK